MRGRGTEGVFFEAGTPKQTDAGEVSVAMRRIIRKQEFALGWSGMPDSNRRPRRPERRALANCATPRR